MGCLDENAINYDPNATLGCQNCCEYEGELEDSPFVQSLEIHPDSLMEYGDTFFPSAPKVISWTLGDQIEINGNMVDGVEVNCKDWQGAYATGNHPVWNDNDPINLGFNVKTSEGILLSIAEFDNNRIDISSFNLNVSSTSNPVDFEYNDFNYETLQAVSSFTMEGQPYDFYSYDLSVQPSPPFNHSLFQEKQSHPYQWEAGAYGTNFSFHIKMAFTFKDSNGIQITKNIYIKFNWAGDTSNEEFWNHPNTSIPYYCTPCDLGDLNNDGGQNVLDVVSMANCILDDDCYDRGYGCSGDMNADGGINVLDDVTLANSILNQDD